MTIFLKFLKKKENLVLWAPTLPPPPLFLFPTRVGFATESTPQKMKNNFNPLLASVCRVLEKFLEKARTFSPPFTLTTLKLSHSQKIYASNYI